MTDRPRVLIEDWLPIAELGIESRRESEIPSALPPIRFLHVWWARRPFAACSGVVLASLLPQWSESLASEFSGDPRVSSESEYRRWVLGLCGISGDPVAAKAKIVAAKEAGRKVVEKDIYGYQRSYLNSPSPASLVLLHQLLEQTWGSLPNVLDPTAGGGSIPFTAARFGLPAHGNDLNGVAASVLRAGVEVPSNYGTALSKPLRSWGDELVRRCEVRLADYFAVGAGGEHVVAYLFARSVLCPRTGKPNPLSPNWWLSKAKGKEAAVRVVTSREGRSLGAPEFEIVLGREAVQADPDEGSVSGGNGVSLWDGLPIPDDYIKAEAQAGRLGSTLYAVAVRYPSSGTRSKWSRGFRAPTPADLAAADRADIECDRVLQSWMASGVVPAEDFPPPAPNHDIRPFGFRRFVDFFSKRQLLVHGTFTEQFQLMLPEIIEDLGEDQGRAVAALLGLMQGKAVNWNALSSSWNVGKQGLRSVFDTHSIAFKWTYAEFDGAREMFPWCLEQIVAAYDGLTALYEPGRQPYPVAGQPPIQPGRTSDLRHRVPARVDVTLGSAADLPLADRSQTLVCIDPPYYDNVMYGEISNFFGVWEQHTVGRAWPELLPGGLADEINEAVANVGRFRDFGRRKKELANADYQAKMQAIFVEGHRVLRDDGVMTVMFTHKRAEAWDTLGMALMQAGFEIATSWPVNTEFEQSLHQAKKNAASSTVMLVCRKRPSGSHSETFFEDLVPEIKTAARDAVTRFEADGIRGVDLLLSTYGPVLSVISANWPVYSSEAGADGAARLLRPEEALDVAREELVQARRRSIVGRQVTFDPLTDFWLIAWELFQAEEFPYDEARRLALAVGGQDPEGLAAFGILRKKTGTVVLQSPADRRRRVLRPVQDGEFDDLSLIDILHGVLITADLDGLAAAKTLMDRHGLTADPQFLALVQGAVNAIPRTKKEGAFIRPEAATLDSLATAYLPSVTIPADEPSDTLFDVD